MAKRDRDVRQRFLFEGSDIRGEILSLQDSYQTVLNKASYPPAIAQLIGEFLAGACLLSATLKFDGIISLQASGPGPLSMIMADCTHHHQIRGVAHYQGELSEKTSRLDQTSFGLKDLMGANATLAVTIDPAKGQRYQGIIPIDSNTLSECLTNYFNQSEQLPTRIWLRASELRVGGLLLQALPADLQILEERQKYWDHLSQLANTLTSEEQIQLSHSDQLHRLFHEESLRLFTPSDIQFACSCSKARTANMLTGFGLDEVNAMLKETSPIEVSCQFCHELYLFGQSDIQKLFDPTVPTLH